MTRWLGTLMLGCVMGLVVSGATYSQERGRISEDVLQEVPVDAGGEAPLTVPSAYGRLVNVAIGGEIHYLYFQDDAGAIRMVAIGPRGSNAIQRARQGFQLLTPSVYLMKRGHSGVSP